MFSIKNILKQYIGLKDMVKNMLVITLLLMQSSFDAIPSARCALAARQDSRHDNFMKALRPYGDIFDSVYDFSVDGFGAVF